jgi:hypothetical protein
VHVEGKPITLGMDIMYSFVAGFSATSACLSYLYLGPSINVVIGLLMASTKEGSRPLKHNV